MLSNNEIFFNFFSYTAFLFFFFLETKDIYFHCIFHTYTFSLMEIENHLSSDIQIMFIFSKLHISSVYINHTASLNMKMY